MKTTFLVMFAIGYALVSSRPAKGAPGLDHSDTQGLSPSQVVQKVEDTWMHDPSSYFRCAVTAGTAIAASTNDQVRAAIGQIYANIISKTGPTNDAKTALNYFEDKSRTIGDYLWLLGKKPGREAYMGVAQFLGEVRSLRVPGYSNQFSRYPQQDALRELNVASVDALTNEIARGTFTNLVARNIAKGEMDKLQRKLKSLDKSLTFQLLHTCPRVARADSDYADFIRRIGAAAHLSDEEVAKLLVPPET